MSPIHANKMQSSISTVASQMRQNIRQEVCKLGLGHFPRSDCEFRVVDLSETRHIAVDGVVVRWICKDHACPSALHQCGIGKLDSSIATVDAVAVQNPKVAGSRDVGFCSRVRNRI